MSTDEANVPAWKLAVYGRAISGEAGRRAPRKSTRERILQRQRNRCLYCENRLNAVVRRNGIPVRLQLQWDHFLPYAVIYRNPEDNWVAACHVCNNIKSCRSFDTVADAQAYIRQRWAEKGYEIRAVLADPEAESAPVPTEEGAEEQPRRWRRYVRVPLDLAERAEEVSIRLEALTAPIKRNRMFLAGSRGTQRRTGLEALDALIAAGKARETEAGVVSVEPYRAPADAPRRPRKPEPHLVPCPVCSSVPSKPCWGKTGAARMTFHPERIAAAEAEVAA